MMRLLMVCAALSLLNGCASLTNPVADGIPVRRVPSEVLGRPKSDLQALPLTLLRRVDPPEYLLDKGDVLAVLAGDLFGPENVQPPVTFSDGQGTESAVGYPVPVRDDGTIALPNAAIKPISVKGKSVPEVEQLVRDAVEAQLKLFQPGAVKISVQLQRRRRYSILVIREDTQAVPTTSAGGVITQVSRRNGVTVSLEAYKNDVLRALNQSGGPPGLDARNEVIIQRGTYDPDNPEKGVTRIPLRVYPDQPFAISEADITLNEGDVLSILARDTEQFYTGGVLGSRQISLPRDYDLDVLQAIALVGGPLVNGGFTQNAFIAQSFASGLGTPSPVLCTVLRKLPDGRQIPIRVDLSRALKDPRERIRILPDDFVVMQEKPGDAITRYMTQNFRFGTNVDSIRGENITQTITSTLP